MSTCTESVRVKAAFLYPSNTCWKLIDWSESEAPTEKEKIKSRVLESLTIPEQSL